MLANIQYKYLGSAEAAKDFARASFELESYLKKIGVPYYEASLAVQENFSSLDPKNQIHAIRNIKMYSSICEFAIKNGFECSDLRLTWYAMSLLGLRPPNSLFGHLEKSNCIEIYDSNGIQIYRNFNFFSKCSYSFQDLVTSAWQELYEREIDILDQLNAIAYRALHIETDVFEVEDEVPAHLIFEIKSAKRRTSRVKFRHISPLYNSENKRSAILTTSKIEVMAEHCHSLKPALVFGPAQA